MLNPQCVGTWLRHSHYHLAPTFPRLSLSQNVDGRRHIMKYLKIFYREWDPAGGEWPDTNLDPASSLSILCFKILNFSLFHCSDGLHYLPGRTALCFSVSQWEASFDQWEASIASPGPSRAVSHWREWAERGVSDKKDNETMIDTSGQSDRNHKSAG